MYLHRPTDFRLPVCRNLVCREEWGKAHLFVWLKSVYKKYQYKEKN